MGLLLHHRPVSFYLFSSQEVGSRIVLFFPVGQFQEIYGMGYKDANEGPFESIFIPE
jgi:hypothetical protein